MRNFFARGMAIASLGMAGMLAGGCIALQTPDERDEEVARQHALARDVAGLKQDRTAVQTQLAALQAEVRSLQEQQRQAQELRSHMAAMENQMVAMDGTYKNRLAQLKTALDQESQNRQKAIDSTINAVSQEIADTVTKTQKPAPAPASAAQQKYTVQKGDTLAAISKAFGVTIDALKTANGISGNLIREGQVLTIPGR